MMAIDGEHQPVEKSASLRGRAQKEPIHCRCEPYHSQVIAERACRTHRLAIDAAAPAGGGPIAAGGVDSGAERCQPERAFDFGGHGPRAIALVVSHVLERRATQSASRQ